MLCTVLFVLWYSRVSVALFSSTVVSTMVYAYLIDNGRTSLEPLLNCGLKLQEPWGVYTRCVLNWYQYELPFFTCVGDNLFFLCFFFVPLHLFNVWGRRKRTSPLPVVQPKNMSKHEASRRGNKSLPQHEEIADSRGHTAHSTGTSTVQAQQKHRHSTQ